MKKTSCGIEKYLDLYKLLNILKNNFIDFTILLLCETSYDIRFIYINLQRIYLFNV